jgi:hypothetical protein
VKVFVHVKDEVGNDIIEPKWYAANKAAQLLSHAIPQLHGPSAPIPGVEFSWPDPPRREARQ